MSRTQLAKAAAGTGFRKRAPRAAVAESLALSVLGSACKQIPTLFRTIEDPRVDDIFFGATARASRRPQPRFALGSPSGSAAKCCGLWSGPAQPARDEPQPPPPQLPAPTNPATVPPSPQSPPPTTPQ